jgi:hypothetical protein
VSDPVTSTILAFLADIGLPVQHRAVTGPTAVPGITIDHGTLVVDPDTRSFPGDLLHEAGHVALLPPSVRAGATGRLEVGGGYEVGAICWSVAAAWHLGLELDVVFHEEGYRGESDRLALTYRSGIALGAPMLEWAGLTWVSGREPAGEQPFPAMRRWVRVDEVPVDEP